MDGPATRTTILLGREPAGMAAPFFGAAGPVPGLEPLHGPTTGLKPGGEDSPWHGPVPRPDSGQRSAAIADPGAVTIALNTDDHPANSSTTGRVTVGGGVTGTIETSGDRDWFRVDLVAGRTYRISLSGRDTNSGTLRDPYLAIYSPSGQLLAGDDDSGPGWDSELLFVATSTGTFFIQASNSNVTDTGTYRLTVAEQVDDFAGGTATTGQVSIGGTVSGTIDFSGDSDWFAVDLVAGQTYEFRLSGLDGGGGTLPNPYLTLRSGIGGYITEDFLDSGPGRDDRIRFTATTTGRHFLDARATSGSGTYRLTAIQLEDDFSATTATTGRVTLGGSITGNIQYEGDEDWFAVDLVAGQVYEFQLSGVDGGGGTLPNPSLRVRSATGVFITEDYLDSGPGRDDRILFTATTTGRYFLDARSPSGTGTYRLTATQLQDDFSATTATTGRVTAGSSATGNIQYEGDRDWLALDVAAGWVYVISLSGVDGGGGTLPDPELAIYSASGVFITSDQQDSGPGRDDELTYIATSTGRIFVQAFAPSGSTATGSYTVAVRAIQDDFRNDTLTGGRLAVGASISGDVQYNADTDWIAIDLEAGRTYTFDLSGAGGGGGTLVNPQLWLYNGSGSLITWDDDNGPGTDSRITYTAAASGRFYLVAASSITGTGTYRLSAAVEPRAAVDPDGPVSSSTPTDPLFPSQWHLHNPNGGINVVPVWADYTGRGVRIGVLDQGIDDYHRDLDDNLILSRSITAFTRGAGGRPILADDNHGTAVAGVAAAERNGYGGVGVAYNADLVSFYDPLSGTDAAFATAVNNTYLHSIQNVDVLNNSWGYGNFFRLSPSQAFRDNFRVAPFNVPGATLERLVREGRNGLGTVVVQSAGNTDRVGDDTNLHSFQNSRFIVTVAATDINGRIASFSTPGSSILVSAPGVNVVTADRRSTPGYSSSGDSVTANGTSFSAPIVSGVIALMLEANPRLGYRDVQEILALSARQTDTANSSWRTTGATAWNGGGMHYSESYGFGLVDARAAVRLAETWPYQQTRANEATLSGARTGLSLPIPDGNLTGVSDTLSLSGTLLIDRVEIDLDIRHTYIGDLTVTITSPSGTRVSIVNRPGQGDSSFWGSSQDNISFTFGIAAFRGESASGTWTITAMDSENRDVGSLTGWTVRAFGTSGTANDNHVFTDDFARLAGLTPGRRTITDTDGGTDVFNGAALTGAMTVDLGTGTATVAGQSVTVTANAIEQAIGGDGDDLIIAGTADSLLVGARGNDTLRGGVGADTLVGGRGNDTIEGGGGFDTVRVNAFWSTTTLTRDGDAVILAGPDGTDRLVGVERIEFTDRAIILAAPSWQTQVDGLAVTIGGAPATVRQIAIPETIDPVRGALGSRVQIGSSPVSPTLRSGWQLALTADLDGNGRTELFFFGVDRIEGFGATWELDEDGNIVRTQVQAQMRVNGWEAAGAANVNGRRGDEIIWQNSRTGAKAIWTDTNADGVIDAAGLIEGLPDDTRQRIVGVNDMDEDGLSELLLFNDQTGRLSVFELTPQSNGLVSAQQIRDYDTFQAYQAAAPGTPERLFVVQTGLRPLP